MASTPLTLNTARAAEERPYLEATFGFSDDIAFKCFQLRMAECPEISQKLLQQLREASNGAFDNVSDTEVARQFWDALPLEKKIPYYGDALIWKSSVTWGAPGNRITLIN
jgi:hypothetical protein